MKDRPLKIINYIVIILVAGLITFACQKSSTIEEKKEAQPRNITANVSQQRYTSQDSNDVAFDKISKCVEPNVKRKRLPEGEKAYIADSTSTVGLIQEGFVFSTERFLESMKITVQEIQFSQISPELVNKITLLIIPGDGIDEKYRSEADYERLKSYVINGGTLLVFTQSTGKSYANLMDGVEAIGYKEDKTHNFINVSIVDMLPLFDWISPKTFVMAFDGHFTKYPANTKVYLKRDQFNQPVAIGYPLGKGLIIATTSFTPEDYDRGYATEDNMVFFREVFNYFKSPMELPKVKAGQDIKIKLKVVNDDKEEKATKVEVEVYDPDKVFRRHYEKVPVDLAPGASTNIEFTYHTCPTAPHGIWHVTYGLLTEGYQLLTSELDPEGTNVWLESVLQAARDALDSRFVVVDQ